jgi:hypothetical protein
MSVRGTGWTLAQRGLSRNGAGTASWDVSTTADSARQIVLTVIDG